MHSQVLSSRQVCGPTGWKQPEASEAALVTWFSGANIMAAFLGLAGLWFVADATLLWRDRLYRTWQMRLFLLGWNLIALATMPIVWRSAVLAK